LSQIVAKQGGDEADAREQELLEEVLAIEPGNLFILLKRLSVAVRRNDRKAKRETMAQLNKLAPAWSGAGAADARKHLIDLAPTVAGPPSPRSYIGVGQLENLLRPEPTYQRSRFAVDAPGAQAGSPSKPSLSPHAGALHAAHAGSRARLRSQAGRGGRYHGQRGSAGVAHGEGAPAVFVANGKEARQAGSKAPAHCSFPAARRRRRPRPTRAGIDWNNDQRNDLLLAGAGRAALLPARCEGALHRRSPKRSRSSRTRSCRKTS